MTGLEDTLKAELPEQVPRRMRDRLAAIAAVASVAGWCLVFVSRYPAGDAIGYFAAGERLNAGHLLYALSAGDRSIPTDPPFFSAPFLYPPAFAVPWRLLAALPSMLGLALWMALLVAVMTAWLAIQLRDGRMGTALLMVVLSYPIALTAVTGNINGFLMVAFALVWQIRKRDTFVGGLVGTLAAWKIFPGLLLLWMIGGRRWRAAGWTLVAGLTWGVIGVVGAGTPATLTYLTQVIPSTKPMGISLAFLFGWPPLTVVLMALGGTVVLLLSVRRPRAAYATAVVTAVVAWPSLGPASLAMLMSFPAIARSG